MALFGNLKDFSATDILSLLSQQRKTGILTMTDGSRKSRIDFHRGKIIRIEVEGRTPQSVVKNVLIDTGRVDNRIYEELVLSAKRTKTDFYTLLVSKGYLSRVEHGSWYQIAAEDLTMEILSWSQGRYRFETEEVSMDKHGINYMLSTDFLVLEGMRRLDEEPNLNRQLPDTNMVFKVAKADYEDYELGPDLYVIRTVDGKKSLSDLQKEVPFGRFRFMSTVVNLWKAEFIEPVEEWESKGGRFSKSVQVKRTALIWVCLAALVLFSTSVCVRQLLKPVLTGPPEALKIIERQVVKHRINTALLNYAVSSTSLPENLETLVQDDWFKPAEIKILTEAGFLYRPDTSGAFSLGKP
jgi:hypothetical protein